MTPHDKALEAAYTDEACLISEHGLLEAIQTYLTTLLDSPEMVEKISKYLFCELQYSGFKEVDTRTFGNDIIKAIKEEAGL